MYAVIHKFSPSLKLFLSIPVVSSNKQCRIWLHYGHTLSCSLHWLVRILRNIWEIMDHWKTFGYILWLYYPSRVMCLELIFIVFIICLYLWVQCHCVLFIGMMSPRLFRKDSRPGLSWADYLPDYWLPLHLLLIFNTRELLFVQSCYYNMDNVDNVVHLFVGLHNIRSLF